MFYSQWMSYIKDDVKITELIIPGAHNAGSYGMKGIAECQRHNLLSQFKYGMRQFCLRLNTDRKGNIVLAHGVTKGDLFENALKDLKTALEGYSTEFLLLDVREYYPQKFGPVTLTYKADKVAVNELLKKYLCPEENAYCDFKEIKDVTVGDIRKSGKRFILINDNEDYEYSKNCNVILPWDKQINGSHAKEFADRTLRFFDDYETDGLFWFQTQQTPNLGVPIGLSKPFIIDKELRMHFKRIIKGIEDNPIYLRKANIIAGDFMTEDYMKSKLILNLNLSKGNVKNELVEQYETGLNITY